MTSAKSSRSNRRFNLENPRFINADRRKYPYTGSSLNCSTQVTRQDHLMFLKHFILSKFLTQESYIYIFRNEFAPDIFYVLHSKLDFFWPGFSKFSMVTAVQISLIFPPKDLEKIRALKIRMRLFLILINHSKRLISI